MHPADKVEILAQRLWQIHAHSYPHEPDPIVDEDHFTHVNWRLLEERNPHGDVSKSLFRCWAKEILEELK